MGADKALLVDGEGRSLLERARSCLEPLAAEVLLACGPSQRYAELGAPLVLDRRHDGGPLAGLEAALERASTRWLLVLACDMPKASTATLAELLETAQARELDVCALSTPAGIEPLYAVYSKACLEPVRAALDAGERRMISFHGGLSNGRKLRVATLELGRGELAWNLNTPEDLDRYRRGAP